MKTHQTLMLIFVLALLSMLHGCKKEPQSGESPGQSDEMAYSPKAARLVANINSFKQKMTHIRENLQLKSGEVISKEDARWNLETLFNATYGFPDLTYRKTVTDTALLYLPVDASGNALLEDVVAVYDEILSLVTSFYINANFDEKGFLFMQLSSGEVVNGQLEIRLEAVTGARTSIPDDPPSEYKPFVEGDNWLYGDNLGKCNASIDTSDAADQIQSAIQSNMPGWPVPPNGFRWMTANPFTITLTGDEYTADNDYLIFYVEDFTEADMCLEYTKMNFHYLGQKKVLYSKVPNDPIYPQFGPIEDWVLLIAEIEGKMNTTNSPRYIHHENKISYAERYLVPIYEIELPIELSSE